jgi:chorismate dehydratase
LRPIGKPVSISIVNYTNTLPFRWALKRSDLLKQVDLQEDIPSQCAHKLKTGQVDLALVPVALLAELREFRVNTKFCIGADGIVDSVKLYHNVPLDQVQTVVLDYQSRTSVNLARVLFRFAWEKDVRFENATPGFETLVAGTRAAVVIGDRTFALNGKYRYETDLAQAWKEFTGLPFVFAAWVSHGELPPDFIKAFESILAYGVDHIDQAVEEDYEGQVLSKEQVKDYLHHRIDYKLDKPKLTALSLFLDYLSRLERR